ncbi:activator-dependent family glycosyltransferase [Nonomuraea sp. MCN248]|uniref:Activator-dependent family glycosyltransferase n=1 Tax=Nonomuraea corallina TaxID=2989783 RepID=A0ABT4SN66_9ACTN|nr:activator-dependent family glycosyltransferase [Nonomuraea corallina]MDA0638390.1 activator-dependent family glycosyltransferase [Nonomuraea corallina]
MRVLIVTHAEKTHFLGMTPLAWALRTAGHEVRVASQPALADVVTAAGLDAVPVGADHSHWRLMRSYDLFGRLTSPQPPFGRAADPLADVGWEYVRDGYRRVVPWWWRLINDPMVDDLVAFCRAWRPRLVIWGAISYAGALAARACGAAHARMPWGADIFGRMRAHALRLMAGRPPAEREDPLAAWLGARARAYGMEFREELTEGQFTIDCIPPSMQVEVDPPLERVRLRYVPYNGRAVVPDWLRRPPERPRVCLSWGVSSHERHGTFAVPAGDVLDALADLDVEVVVLGPRDPADARPLPANARARAFAPLAVLLPTCAAVINHGGWGTVNTAAYHGVPQLVVPSWFDTPLTARRLADGGASLTLPAHEAEPGVIREMVRRLVEEPGFRRAAGRLRDEMHAMPSPNEAGAAIIARALASGP